MGVYSVISIKPRLTSRRVCDACRPPCGTGLAVYVGLHELLCFCALACAMHIRNARCSSRRTDSALYSVLQLGSGKMQNAEYRCCHAKG